VGSDDESTIKVSTKKDKQQKSGTIKLKKPAPKHRDPGNWKDDSVVDG
jgi:SAGA-associated factor 73